MVFVGTEELENRLRRDLLVDEDGGKVGAHARTRTKTIIVGLDATRVRLPCAGHTMLAAPEVGDAVLEEEDIWRAPRHPGVEATMYMEATPIWHRQDVRRSNLWFMMDHRSASDALLAVIHLPHGLRAGVSRLRRDAEADVAEQPDRVGNERRDDHKDDEDGAT